MSPRFHTLILLALLAGTFLSCSSTKDEPVPPSPPPTPLEFNVTGTGDNYAHLTWYSPSGEETGFHLWSRVDTTWQVIATFTASDSANVYRTVTGLTPGTTYTFRVTAFNDAGDSSPSNERTTHTTGTNPPEPPVNIHAEVFNSRLVNVFWTPVGTQDGFYIQRHTAGYNWTTIGSAPGTDTVYADNTAIPITTFYYRVGSYRGTVTSWSADSVEVTTPDGPPSAPDSLTTQTVAGIGIRLRWADRSNNETGFHIRRNDSGGPFAIVDSVGANVTLYFDSLSGNPRLYNYELRAFNSYGFSAWTSPVPAYFGYCSFGVIPLCQNSWWEYLVTDTSTGDSARRRFTIGQLQYVNGVDYYPYLGNTYPYNDPSDTLYYLHNYSDQLDNGCYLLHNPLENPPGQLLYKYPAGLGETYYVDGRQMLVASTNTDIQVGDSVYLDCYVYQLSLSGNHTRTIYVEPNRLGIVKEFETVGSSTVVNRDLVNYYLVAH